MFRMLLLGLAGVFGIAGYIWYASPPPKQPGPPKMQPVAVSTTPAVKRDVPVLLYGIGAAQALNTVQIRSRVDGALDVVNFQEGQRVKKGEVLARIDPRLYEAALNQAKAKLAQDQAQLITDRKDMERNQTLNTQRFASQQAVDQITAKVDVDKAVIEADKALISTAQTNLDYTTITAPFDGLMGLRNIDPGNIIRASDTTPIATITQHEPIFVLFTLPENQFAQVREALRRGDVPVKALDENGKRVIANGLLRVVDNQIDQTTGTIRLKAQFPNADDELWPGQFTPAQVQAGIEKGAVVVPTASIQRGPNGVYVWLATPDGHAIMQPIKPGAVFEGITVAETGVKEGDQIIISNQYRLQQNSPLTLDTQPVASNEGNGRS